MQQTVTTTPVVIGERQFGTSGVPIGLSRPIIQNLGADPVYLDLDSEVAAGTGYELAAGEAIEFQGHLSRPLYGVSGGSSDLRIIDVG